MCIRDRSVIPVIVPPVIVALADSMLATSVPTVYPVPDTLTVVVGAACKSLNSFHLPESSASQNKPPYKSCEPEVSYRP